MVADYNFISQINENKKPMGMILRVVGSYSKQTL